MTPEPLAENLAIDLIHQMRDLSVEMAGLTAEVANLTEASLENKKRDARIQWSRRAVIASIMVAVVALILGFSAKATSEDIKQARRDAQQLSCTQDNTNNDLARLRFTYFGVALKKAADAAVGDGPPDSAAEALVRYDSAVDEAVTQAVNSVPQNDTSVACKLAGR